MAFFSKLRDYCKINLLKSINSTSDFLTFLFGVEVDSTMTMAAYSSYFKFDSLHPDLVSLVEEGENGKANEMVNHLETEVYDSFTTNNDGDLTDFFMFLKRQIGIYTDIKMKNELFEAAKAKKIAINGAFRNKSTDPAMQLNEYFTAVLNDGRCRPCSSFTFTCALFSVLFYIHNGYLPKSFSEQINGTDLDRYEFVNEVLLKYGCSGNPGKHQIYKLANRSNPNSIALFEAAELEYYGTGFSGIPDYQNAFDYYVKATELDNYNALAGWTLGFMYYNYDIEGNPLYDAKIIDIEKHSKEETYDLAAMHLKKSFDRGCPAAANVLGRMLTENRLTEEQKKEIIKKYQLLDGDTPLKIGMSYLEIASDSGYTFAKNNIASRILKMSKREHDSFFIEAYRVFKESADLGEPYAMNRYAKYYLLDFKNDYKGALKYFDEAASLANTWAALNILKVYCTDDEGVKMVRELPRINNDNEKYYYYIKRIKHLCYISKEETIQKEYNEWKEEYDSLYGTNKK